MKKGSVERFCQCQGLTLAVYYMQYIIDIK